MKARGFVLISLLLLVAASILIQSHKTPTNMNALTAEQPRPVSAENPETTRRQVLPTYGKLPLSFEANHGQTDQQVKFLSRGRGYSLFLTSTEAVLSLNPPQSAPRAESDIPTSYSASLASSAVSSPKQRPTVLRMQLVGANPSPQVAGKEELPGKSNYFIGNDPNQWRSNVPHYAKVRYEDVYPGIDLVYYGNQGQLEYDFVVAPGADPQAIRLTFEGAEKVEVDGVGNLVLNLPDGEVRFHKPYIYQESGRGRHEIAGNFVLRDDEQIGFEVAAYDVSKPLIIDPAVLLYSTYLGGSSFEEGGTGIAVDTAGNVYVTGTTASTDFPTSPGAFDTTCDTGGSCGDVFVTKVNPAGALVYSTYLGGSGGESGHAIAVDVAGNAYVTGSAGSTFPTTPGAFQTTGSGAFITKLNPTGSALIYSTLLGGSSSDSGDGIAVDAAGNAYVTGLTASTDFPTMNALQPAFGGGFSDAFVTKLNATGSGLIYSTYLGGSARDSGGGIAVDAVDNAYVTGFIDSTDFPTMNPFQATFGGGDDGFVTKLTPDGSALVYSTYLGGSDRDRGFGIAVDANGNAYVTGETRSIDFPTSPGAFDTTCDTGGSCGDVFVTKVNLAGALVYSTYLGGGGTSGPDFAFGIAVDVNGNAYVTGRTTSSSFPTVNAFQSTCSVGPPISFCQDAFVMQLNADGSALVYSSYLGGSVTQFGVPGSDVGRGIAVDAAGNAYVTGTTDSTDFPTANPFQAANAGLRDAFIAKIELQPNPVPTLSSLMPSSATAGGAGFTLTANGSDFTPDSVVHWNGSDRTTTFVSDTELQAAIPASDIAVGGTVDVTIFNLAPGGGTSNPLTFTINNPIPSLTSLSPSSVQAGGSDLTLTVIGSDFVPDSVVRWNGGDRATIFVSSTELQAVIPASDIAATGTADVTVFNPTPGGGTSTSLAFIIGNPAPAISSISPGSTSAGGSDFTLTVNGNNFVSDSVVRWNGSDRATTFVSSTQLQAAIPTSDIASGGTVNVTVFNPAPGGGTSNAISFTITDFTVGSSPSSVTVSRGQSASYTVTVSPQFGPFGSTVSLACSLPSTLTLASCSLSPTSVTPGANPATSTLTVTTTAPSAYLVPPFGPRDDAPLYALWLGMPGLLLFGLTLVGHAPSKKLRFWLLIGVLISLLALQVACGGGGSTSSPPPPPPPGPTNPGTPTGTSTITITGTAGSLQHSTTATLVVQ